MTKKLSTFEIIITEQYHDTNVKFKVLGSLVSVKTGKQLNKSGMLEIGNFPVLNGGINPSGFYHTYNTEENSIAISQGGASAGYVNFVKTKFWAGAHCFVVKPLTNEVNNKYLYFFLKNAQGKLQGAKLGAGIPGLGKNELSAFKICVPPLPVQEEIVKTLNSFDELEAKLEAELEARNKQYEYYRFNLLFKGGVDERKVKLIDVSDYSKTRIEASKLDNNNYVGVDNLLQNKQGKTLSSHVPTKGNLTRYEKGDILIGNIRPYLKKIWYADSVGGTNGDVLVIHINEDEKDNLNSKFLYYLLSSDKFFDYNMQFSKGAKMPRGDKSSIMNFEISIPPINEQLQIVSILDKFDTLVNDTSIGLPAEIKARKKQYEYYRNKLLTFKEIKK